MYMISSPFIMTSSTDFPIKHSMSHFAVAISFHLSPPPRSHSLVILFIQFIQDISDTESTKGDARPKKLVCPFHAVVFLPDMPVLELEHVQVMGDIFVDRIRHVVVVRVFHDPLFWLNLLPEFPMLCLLG